MQSRRRRREIFGGGSSRVTPCPQRETGPCSHRYSARRPPSMARLATHLATVDGLQTRPRAICTLCGDDVHGSNWEQRQSHKMSSVNHFWILSSLDFYIIIFSFTLRCSLIFSHLFAPP